MAAGKFVSYLRVSTPRQGRSGLGLEAQRQAVEEYLNGGRWKLVEEVIEVESGRNNKRPQLQHALSGCRLHNATLVVAKLDRLSRNASFLLTLRDSSVEFVAADLPQANRLTVGILAMVAEQEAEAISSRTRAALAAAKRRGVILGRPEHLDAVARRLGTKASAQVRSAQANQRAADLAPVVSGLRAKGAVSLRDLAAELTALDYLTTRGRAWSPAEVRRLLQRINSVV